jgi:hypothetical protein
VRWECDGHLCEPGPTCKEPGGLPRRGFYKGLALLRILPPAIVLTLGPTHFELEVAKRLHNAQWTTDKRGVISEVSRWPAPFYSSPPVWRPPSAGCGTPWPLAYGACVPLPEAAGLFFEGTVPVS